LIFGTYVNRTEAEMEMERIAKMTENIVSAEKAVKVGPEDDEALANVDQALDSILAAVKIIDENLPNVKAGTVPEQAARDAVVDLMDTAIRPYLVDILKAMQVFEGSEE
jgi:hypothetical protein